MSKRRHEIRDQILELMNSHPEGLSLAACSRELGLSISYAKRCFYNPDSVGERGEANTFSDDFISKIRELRYIDGLTMIEVQKKLGISIPSIQKYAPGFPGKINNKKLRGFVVKSDISCADIALRLQWTYIGGRRKIVVGDSSRVKRLLGILPDISNGKKSYRQYIDAEIAEKVANIIGIEPWQAGIFDDEDQAIPQFNSESQ